MLKTYIPSTKALFITASLLTPALSNAATIVTGNLSYNDVTEIITGSTGVNYLGWGVAASLNYAQTITATAIGGIYEDYHIASQTEVYTFYKDALVEGEYLSNGDPVIDVVGAQSWTVKFNEHKSPRFGDNYRAGDRGGDYAWFLSDEGFEIGYINIRGAEMLFVDSSRTLAFSDQYSASGSSPNQAISWLLVSDEQVSQVPVPATIWLMGSALLGVAGLSKRKKRAIA